MGNHNVQNGCESGQEPDNQDQSGTSWKGASGSSRRTLPRLGDPGSRVLLQGPAALGLQRFPTLWNVVAFLGLF